jgi:hypothetical protein
MDDEEHLERLQQAVLKGYEWQAANYPPLADLSRANLGSVGEISSTDSTSTRFSESRCTAFWRVLLEGCLEGG